MTAAPQIGGGAADRRVVVVVGGDGLERSPAGAADRVEVRGRRVRGADRLAEALGVGSGAAAGRGAGSGTSWARKRSNLPAVIDWRISWESTRYSSS